ncbi:MAG: hypothetical protein E7104_01445 [Prevotella sp.]|nr:hypothetical protein [Prevotella sp.]
MKKEVYRKTTLACTFQQEEIKENECLKGVISKAKDGFKFEEAVKQKRHRLNPKLFCGKYCSLVHMANGRYQIHMKTVDASAVVNPEQLADKIYSELLNAFKFIA